MTVVRTSGGEVHGVERDGAYWFLGIPYGTADRFRPPRAAAWEGRFDATAFGPSCPPTLTEQDRVYFSRSSLWRDYAGVDQAPFDEDCLRLNVWTPASDTRQRPVLFWLHGGGFSWGSGSSTWTWGDRLAARHDLVVVTLNHRLGILGYLDLEDSVGAEWEGSGVAGLLDLQLGLEWVRDNAPAFGGDPDRVTIVGHSGGGAKVSALLALPSAEGLFHRAVIQSGVVSLDTIDRDEGAETAGRLIAESGGVEALQTLPIDELTRLGAGHRFRPVARTRLLPRHPFEPTAAPSAARVPLLIGTTLDDAATFKFDSDPSFEAINNEQLPRWVEEHRATEFGELAGDVIAFYRASFPDSDPPDLLARIATARLRERTEELMLRKLAGGAVPVYAYLFAYRATLPDTIFAGRQLSYHGLELPFVFDISDRIPETGDRPERLSLAGFMSACWASFARSADPGWPAWTPQDRSTMVFDTTSAVERDPFADERPLFDRLRGRRPWTTFASS